MGERQRLKDLTIVTLVEVLGIVFTAVEPIVRIPHLPAVLRRQWSDILGEPEKYYLSEDRFSLIADTIVFPLMGMAVGNYLIREDIPLAGRLAIGFAAGFYVVMSRAIGRDRINHPDKYID